MIIDIYIYIKYVYTVSTHVCTYMKNSKGNYISNAFKLRHEQHWQNHLFPN